jgi:hypothetical protein
VSAWFVPVSCCRGTTGAFEQSSSSPSRIEIIPQLGRRMLEASEGRRSGRYGRYGQKTAEASGWATARWISTSKSDKK